MDCIMGTPEQIQILFGKIDQLVDNSSKTNISVEKLCGTVKALSVEVSHKAEKADIANDMMLHEMSRHSNSKSNVFWGGTSTANKAALIAAIVGFLTAATLYLNERRINDNIVQPVANTAPNKTGE